MPYRSLLLFTLFASAVAGCAQVEDIRDRFRPATPHERYAERLRSAGLEGTAVGRAWFEAAEAALRAPVSAPLPYREVGYLAEAAPEAAGYRLDLRRGQELSITLDAGADSAVVFADLFEVPEDSSRAPYRVASADSTGRLSYRVRRDRAHVLRVQPELLRGGRYTLTIEAGASLSFPVAGVDSRAIRSVFGDPRDGGRRRHHGVDIFAPRGTPAVAAADGYVTRVQTTPLGGKVVWLRERRGGHALYYAHLDSQRVRPNTQVRAGDTLGFVGNTGNAVRTPPHLHFGIYRDGPVDPYPFVHQPLAEPARLRADTTRLGGWARVAVRSASLYTGPETRGDVHRTLAPETAIRLEAGTGGWYRVRLPDGTAGFVDARLTAPADAPLARTRPASGRALYAAPAPTAAAVDTLAPGADAPVLARFDGYLLVGAPGGGTAWLEEGD